MPNCSVWLYIFCIFYCFQLLFIALWNKFLYIYNDIMFPWLPVSTLYGTVIMTLLDDVFRFAVIMEPLALKFMELIFTISMWSSCSWSASCSMLWTVLPLALQHTSLKWFNLLYLAHAIPYIGHHLDGWLEPQYLHFPFGHFNSYMWFYSIMLTFSHTYLIKIFYLNQTIHNCCLHSLDPQFLLSTLILIHQLPAYFHWS